MKYLKTLALILALSAMTSPAFANGSVVLQAQWGFSAGFNSDWGWGCVGSKPYIQCTSIPGTITGWSGTQTVKEAGAELLARVVCKGVTIWQGEQFQGTQIIHSPSQLPPLTGPCWIEYQADSPSNTPEGGGWEMQLTIFYQ